MKIMSSLRAASSLAGAKAFGKRLPLAVSWGVTGRCNLRCAYCGIWAKEFNELTPAEALRAAGEICAAGTARVSLTGGEPLLRQDIGQIIGRLKNAGTSVSMNSNGLLLRQRFNDIAELDHLSLSLDGPRDIHDALRGKDTHAKVMDAAMEASGRGLETSFLTVITKRNICSLGEMLEDAQSMGIKVLFQPVDTYAHSSETAARLKPAKKELARFFRDAPRKSIMNSTACIREFVAPTLNLSNCAAGKIMCRIAPDGLMFPCGRASNEGTHDVRNGFLRGFLSLKKPTCSGCCCAGHVEMSMLFRLNPHSVKRAASL